jgi:hypothetical protein
VAKVPSGLQSAAEHPVKLTGADAFLAGAKQVDGLKPQVQLQVAILKNGADPHRKGLPAGIALAEAGAGRLAVQPSDLGTICVPTMRARRAVRPKLGFDVLKRGVLIVEAVIGQNGLGHSEISHGRNTKSGG